MGVVLSVVEVASNKLERVPKVIVAFSGKQSRTSFGCVSIPGILHFFFSPFYMHLHHVNFTRHGPGVLQAETEALSHQYQSQFTLTREHACLHTQSEPSLEEKTTSPQPESFPLHRRKATLTNSRAQTMKKVGRRQATTPLFEYLRGNSIAMYRQSNNKCSSAPALRVASHDSSKPSLHATSSC